MTARKITTIYEDQKNWLKENNNSASRFLREALDELIRADNRRVVKNER